MSNRPFTGKGSWQRPVKDRQQFEDNWNKIFGGKHAEKAQLHSTVESTQPHTAGSGTTTEQSTGTGNSQTPTCK